MPLNPEDPQTISARTLAHDEQLSQTRREGSLAASWPVIKEGSIPRFTSVGLRAAEKARVVKREEAALHTLPNLRRSDVNSPLGHILGFGQSWACAGTLCGGAERETP